MKKNIGSSLLSFLLAIITIASCNRQSIIPASRMQSRLSFYGFTVARPLDTGWFVLLSEQKDDLAMFRKKLNSNTHTAFVKISLRRMARAATSLEDLVCLDKEAHVFEDTVRFKLLNVTQTPGMRQGQWCVYSTEQIIDNKPAITPSVPLAARAQGFRCIHPIYKNTVALVAEISERGMEEEMDSLIIKEGEEILKSIVLTDTMGVPFK
ncbi:hypothetical protein HY768_03385 [candidate division TA06 bacterium]|uniref:Uncharacterized protein n=1 Tax=candidate division TA06 bacterium TaxID=2250710 RepID=A0A933I7V8_UNCT6|nr:hypothetical protein [candidate division TA06 bacterium]